MPRSWRQCCNFSFGVDCRGTHSGGRAAVHPCNTPQSTKLAAMFSSGFHVPCYWRFYCGVELNKAVPWALVKEPYRLLRWFQWVDATLTRSLSAAISKS